jgi:diacylglycerol kinase (ATP)
MSHTRNFFVVFNPAAGRGRSRRHIAGYLSLLKRHLREFDYAVTTHAGDEVRLTDNALSDGYTSIIAAGGDGTWSIVADRILRSGDRDVTLGLLPAGTGNDFGKSIGVHLERAEENVRGIAGGVRTTIDVGRVGSRYFLNVVGLGFDIAVIDDAAKVPILKGDLLYRFCALRQLFRFPGLPLEISDGLSASRRRDHLMLVIANANYFGGSFHIAPKASLSDGKLDAVSIYNAGPLSRARLFSRVAKGTHEGEGKVNIQQAPGFRIGFEGPIRYEVDGELCTCDGDSLEVSAIPNALSVYTTKRPVV